MSSTLNILASTLLSTPVLHQKHYPIKLTCRFHEVESSTGLCKASLKKSKMSSSTLNILSSLSSTPLLHQKHYPIKLTQRFHEEESNSGFHNSYLDSFDVSNVILVYLMLSGYYLYFYEVKY